MTMIEPTSDLPVIDPPIVARAGAYYRNMRYLMCVVLIAMGAWFAYDGYVTYPKQNDQIRALQDQRNQADRARNRTQSEQLLSDLNRIHEGKLHTDMDLFLQRMLGIVLPPLGVLVLIWALYNSRGEYRLENRVLSVPGHPPIPISEISDVDSRLWERKGIAYVRYRLTDGKSGRVRLDDFLYERAGTDAIYDHLPTTTGISAKPSPSSGTSDLSD